MAYYDALIAKWATAPAGTTQSKIDWVNAQTVTGPAKKMIVTSNELYNKIDRTEFTALTNVNANSIHDIVAMAAPVDMSPGTEMRNQILRIFPQANKPITYGSLTAWFDTFDKPKIPWWQATVAQGGGGLSSPVSKSDCDACVPPLV